MTLYLWDDVPGRTASAPACCANTECPCLDDGRHAGKSVGSAVLGGRFCCRRSYVSAHYVKSKQAYVDRAVTWNKDNPERRRGIAKRHYRKCISDKRDYMLRRNYGITLAGYEEMVMAQCGCCAICGDMERSAQRNREKRLSVHHDHETGAVVALLCHTCNRGMGLLGDDPDRLRRAALLQEGR